ncbi:hypothetical protein [Riemerella columbina]|uniref:hypothetical protein n=1 Tax=Riemerella columbina TaxID=103810 RepID=UPI00266FB5A3|nr:hypothetical protein [Riemerella columbina]WKS94976.1 hypothetical protein NYR17_08615 [Riemerella columbina]
MEEFEVPPGGLTLNDYYTVSCMDNTYNLMFDAAGIPPLKYEIIEKDGTPFYKDNGNDPVFVNLAEGTYKVKLSDSCGNSIIANVKVNRNKLPVIKPSNLCEGANGKLYIDGLSFMNIEWSKDGVVISPSATNNNTLTFTPYHSATHAGLYEAKITYQPNPNSCISNTISFNLVAGTESNPNAGTGQTVTIDKNDVTSGIDLFSYLTPPYDNYGEWVEVSNSGLLVDNIWYAELASANTYTFNYVVDGACSNQATATVVINLIGACYEDPTTTGTVLSSNHGITTLIRAGVSPDNITGNEWPMVRKGAWTVLESNKKGFVLTRVADPNTAIAKPKEGMIVYDTTQKCLSIYSDGSWKCFNVATCP